MKKVIFTLFFSVLLCHVKAEGPPIDSLGNIWVPYVSIALNTDQLIRLSYDRRIVLSDDQLRLLNNPSFPRYIEVVDPFYRECTCGILYGIWYTPDSLAILQRDVEKNFTAPTFADLVLENDTPGSFFENGFFIDIKGHVYHRGSIVSEGDIKFTNDSLMGKEVFIFLPPKNGNKHWDEVNHTLDLLVTYLPKRIKVVVL